MPKHSGDTIPPIVVRGASLTKDVSQQVQSLLFSMSTGEVSEMTVSILDAELKVYSTGVFKDKTPVDIMDLKLLIAGHSVGGGPSGNGQVTLDLQPRLVQALRDMRGANVVNNVSPSTYVELGVKKAGGKAVVQPTPKRAQVARDVTVVGQGGSSSDNNEWTTFDRLAQEEGFILYESLGTVYFAKPSWLSKNLPVVRVVQSFNKDKPDPLQCIGVPECSSDVITKKKTITIEVPLKRSDEFTTQKALQLDGMPNYSGRYLITKVAYPASGAGRVTIDAETPVDPDPQPADKEK